MLPKISRTHGLSYLIFAPRPFLLSAFSALLTSFHPLPPYFATESTSTLYTNSASELNLSASPSCLIITIMNSTRKNSTIHSTVQRQLWKQQSHMARAEHRYR